MSEGCLIVGIVVAGSLSAFSCVSHRGWDLVFFPDCWDARDWSRLVLLIAVCDLFDLDFILYSCADGLMPFDYFWLIVLFWWFCCFAVSSPG